MDVVLPGDSESGSTGLELPISVAKGNGKSLKNNPLEVVLWIGIHRAL